MSAVSSSFVSLQNQKTQFLSGSSSKPVNNLILSVTPSKHTSTKRSLVVRAGYETMNIHISQFLGDNVPPWKKYCRNLRWWVCVGGIIVGALGCVYAPQISKALAEAGADRKDLMRKLPKFIYDEEKALEKTRKILAEKIAQLNSAIDDVSAQLHPDDTQNGVAVSSDEVEASI